MSIFSEINRFRGARDVLTKKMKDAGYVVNDSMEIGTLVDMLELKPLPAKNLIPDTDSWYMSNRKQPDMKGNYSFEATFKKAWEGFICDFSPALMERIKGKVVIIGVDTLEGANARLELLVDGAFKAGILQHSDPRRMKIMIPGDAASVTLRIIMFDSEDLHCKFTGVYMTLDVWLN